MKFAKLFSLSAGFCIFFSVLMVFSGEGICPFAEIYPDPVRYAGQIEEFIAADMESFPPEQAVLCIGSSSMRGWGRTIKEDLAPLTVIPRGFGGSTMYDVLFYADKIVLPYAPRAILIYEGENDISAGVSPEMVYQVFLSFVNLVHLHYPETRIYFISLKPSILRWHLWDKMMETNALIAAECEAYPLLTFYDISEAMLDESGQPNPDIFVGDNLHMNAQGYQIWADVIGPPLKQEELHHEIIDKAKDSEKQE